MLGYKELNEKTKGNLQKCVMNKQNLCKVPESMKSIFPICADYESDDYLI